MLKTGDSGVREKMTDFNLTKAFITSLTGSPDTECDWRIINDRDKGEQALNLRGTLATLATTLSDYNSRG